MQDEQRRVEAKRREEEERRLAEVAEAQRLERRHERDAHQAVATAAAEFERGQHRLAIATLERFTPPHPVVTEALQTLTARLERLERQREEEASARAVAEELQRAETLARLLASVDGTESWTHARRGARAE